MRRVSAAVLGLFLGLVAAVALLGFWGFRVYTAPGPLKEAVTVVIPKGSGRDAILRRLLAAGVVEDPLVFRTAVRLTGAAGHLKAGEYRFPPHVSIRRALERIVAGKTVLRMFTAREGRTTYEILAHLKATEGLEGEISLKPREGELLPETYSYALGDTRDAVVKRMREAMTDVLNELWETRAKNLPIKTKRQALILASIIEKETGKAVERARVAAVFVNRLRKGMRLQTDPTVIYGITKGKGPLGRRLLSKDLEKKTPYNTYRIDGLPPGPIANPGRASIAAALNPAKTKDLYFVADGTGGHVFSETLEDHQKNVRRWREIRKQREAEEKKAEEAKKEEEAKKTGGNGSSKPGGGTAN
jgi:peptidoglycan lytic transglycosylase G